MNCEVPDVGVRPGLNAIEVCAGSGRHGEAVRDVVPGARVVCYVERDAAAAALLAARIADGSLDDAPVWTDLRTFDGGAWRGVVDLVVGGFPCQPYSVAGKRRGAEDERDLWDDCLRIVRETGARLAFFENVGGGLREYHRRFRPDLAGIGYRVEEVVCKASDVGAPHGRERLFFLAVADGAVARGRGVPARPRGGGSGAPDADGGGAELADAGHAERPGRDGAPGGGAREARDVAAPRGRGASVDVEHAADQRRERGGEAQGSQQPGPRQGHGAFGAFPPGNPYDDRGNVVDAGAYKQWQRILAERPDLAPATQSRVRGVADGDARGIHFAYNVVQRLMACDCRCHAPRYSTETGSTGLSSGRQVRAVWDGGVGSSPPRRPEQAVVDPDAVREVSYGQAQGNRHGNATCRSCNLPSVRTGLPAETFAELCGVLGLVPACSWDEVSREAVGREADDKDVRGLRPGVRFQTTSGADLQQEMRQRIGLATSDLARADRLRILGNAVVSQQAAYALRRLLDWMGVDL